MGTSNLSRNEIADLVGKLALHKQEIVQESLTMYYDEAESLEDTLMNLRNELQEAKKYRNIYFFMFNRAVLPEQTFRLTPSGIDEAKEAERIVKQYLNL